MQKNIPQNHLLTTILESKYVNNKKIIAVGGLSRSGKSTFIANMREALNGYNISSITISLDYWILPIEKRKPGMTVRERFQYDLLTKDLKELILDKELSFPPYHPHTRSVSSKQVCISLKNAACIFIDGVIALDHPFIKEISSLNIYIEQKEEVRKERFIQFYKSKNISEEEIQLLYEERQNDESPIIILSKNNADYIIHT